MIEKITNQVYSSISTLNTNSFLLVFAGEFRVAGIYPIFADVTTDLFTAAAVELVNEGVWEPDFKSMFITIHLSY